MDCAARGGGERRKVPHPRLCAAGTRRHGVTPTPGSCLYRATVRPEAVLARFDSREEQEAVINPNMLRGRIEVLETGGSLNREDVLPTTAAVNLSANRFANNPEPPEPI